MDRRESSDESSPWLATVIKRLLDEKFGPGRVPGVRAISADIGRSNGGETISHGHIHNILTGEADNLTDRTRRLLATYFGKDPSYFIEPVGDRPSDMVVQALAGRFATFGHDQLAAIRQAIDIVTDQHLRDQRQQ